MATITVIDEVEHTVTGEIVGGRVLVDPAGLPDAIGWELKAEGLCRDEVCVPVRDPAAIRVGGRVDLVAACDALGRATVVEGGLGVVAVALPSEERRRVLQDLVASPFTLPDLDGVEHELAEWRGLKKMLLAFSTW